MPVTYHDLSSTHLSEVPLNVVVIGSGSLLSSIHMNSMCVESGIFPINNQLKTLSTISSTLTPSAEHGASAETFFSVGDKMQRVAVCAIPTGKIPAHIHTDIGVYGWVCVYVDVYMDV